MPGPIARLIGRRFRPSDVDFHRRGFPLEPAATRRHLEARAGAFIDGSRAFTADPAGVHGTLAAVDPQLRGFGYEGAGMAAYLLDAAHAGTTAHVSRLLAGPGHGYRHLVHVGVGWAMARLRLPLPRPARGLDPLLRWLTLDGAGFQQMFFQPARTVAALRAAGPVGSGRETVRRTGHGRALWFTHTADVERIAATIGTVAPPARAGLWSGVGLAAAYAGAPGGVDGAALLAAAGPHRDHLGQGLVFGAAARAAHEHVPGHTARLLDDCLGISAATALAWAETDGTDLARPGCPVAGYEQWRQRLRQRCLARLDEGAVA